jgi:hypothetical protein
MALFSKANPVSSLELLEPIEPDHLTQSERSSMMTEVQTIQPKKDERQRWPRVALGMAMALIAVVALGFLVNRETAVASPEAVANSFMNARANWDGEQAQALFASDAVINDFLAFKADQYPAFYDWLQSTNQTVTQHVCVTIVPASGGMGTLVRCTWITQNDLSRALGYESETEGIEMRVNNGAITGLAPYYADSETNYDAMWAVLVAWVEDNHPEASDQMLTPDKMLDSESLALWKQYVPEFVASHQD